MHSNVPYPFNCSSIFFYFLTRWTRLWKLAFLVAFIVGLVVLGAVDLIDTFGQVKQTTES